MELQLPLLLSLAERLVWKRIPQHRGLPLQRRLLQEFPRQFLSIPARFRLVPLSVQGEQSGSWRTFRSPQLLHQPELRRLHLVPLMPVQGARPAGRVGVLRSPRTSPGRPSLPLRELFQERRRRCVPLPRQCQLLPMLRQSRPRSEWGQLEEKSAQG